MKKTRRIEDLGLDPILLERDRQRGLAMIQKFRDRQAQQKGISSSSNNTKASETRATGGAA